MVAWSVYDIHWNEDLYSNPGDFIPHRFDGKESNTLQDDNWFGFGMGPRACPAVRWVWVAMRVFLVNILKNYKIVKTDKTILMEKVKIAFKEKFNKN